MVSVLLIACIVLLVICGVWQALEMREAEKERERAKESKNLKFDTLDTWEIYRVTRQLLRADKQTKRKAKRGGMRGEYFGHGKTLEEIQMEESCG